MAASRHMNITRRLLTFVGLTSLLFATGCLEGNATRTGPYVPPKPAHAPIDVYIDATPAAAWAEVGQVSVYDSYYTGDFDDLIRALEDRARSLGADAVIVTDIWSEEEVYYDEWGYSHSVERMRIYGTAAIYLDSGPTHYPDH